MVGAGASSAAERTARAFTVAWERQDFRAHVRAARRAVAARLLAARVQARLSRRRGHGHHRPRRGRRSGRREPRRGDGAGRAAHAGVRPRGCRPAPTGRRRADHLGPAAGVPRPAARRGAQPPQQARTARHACCRATARCSPVARSDRRTSPLEAIAGSIAGTLAPEETAEERRALYAHGFPRSWPVGQSGLEEAFESRLAGRPGGRLLAGRRVIARARPVPALPVRTTIDTRLQEAAVTALAGRFGGIAAHRPAQRRDPSAGRDRLLGAPAARLDLQDRHHRGGAARPAP